MCHPDRAGGGFRWLHPFYNSATCGVFGAALAAADLEGLDADGMADALGQAGMQAAGTWQCRLEPTFSKPLACAHAARAGVFSAELAAAGFPGARHILTGPLGFFASYYPEADPSTLLADPDANWAIWQVSFKPFPACRHTHPAISAALQLAAVARVDEIAQVDIHTYQAALDFCDQATPFSPDSARFSLQHTVATALVKGTLHISDADSAVVNHPEMAALRRKIFLHLDSAINAAFPAQYGARLVLTMADGAVHERSCPAAWGDPENPMSDIDLVAKFKRNADYGGVTATGTDALAKAVLDLPHASDLSGLHQALNIALSTALPLEAALA